MTAKVLLALLALAIATGSVTACKRKSVAPTAGKESTAVDTTTKR